MPMALSQLPFGGAEYFQSLPILSDSKATTHQVRMDTLVAIGRTKSFAENQGSDLQRI
jgi:hypothetical protein